MFLFDTLSKKTTMPTEETALPGREEALAVPELHFVNGRPLKGPYPDGLEIIYLGMGCFWGAERLFWQTPGVWVTAVGYTGGFTRNPTYQETTTGQTGHAEVVKVVYDPAVISLSGLLRIFFEEHDPTQGMRQGNDVGTTYRSAIYATTEGQLQQAQKARDVFQQALEDAGHGRAITTEIGPLETFYYAEDYHQQYLAKNPGGYCGLRGTGVSCNID
ncbi:Peptide methionine sulfoxide reductase MsrA [Rhizobium rhizogenes]|uniref:Peptide methionine sulfoxide reductase MsrA n=1 Tax=Rhizobium rhizogenes TaxID=359 RepID=A0AAN2A595_RHIRH|nr:MULTISPECIES: peptide-methionine (S)-S-oxide reductase MsrA [Rhizobium/Agrobacterium group]AQS63006.1 peptide-methionine (S)-S-oxide reductase MsrA [Rhizobium rhizogenes]MCZ7442207.1 peptide-methionine (S)-S-oxide reductase MsrA [Rhizobium rhizogenes]NSZ77585.1 peptide-methionine (S)-S-oxide reductase MsrA [Agrobacterium tumefaciens]OAM64516.1 peptide-methionine (S)-S-oxide reductase [Rhizobium rhizogenes]CAD0214077.1 Peptide methionine sulfoxide reductase MsrA [Rhizobium rhizogenes]